VHGPEWFGNSSDSSNNTAGSPITCRVRSLVRIEPRHPALSERVGGAAIRVNDGGIPRGDRAEAGDDQGKLREA
jgi:hypothetical protein